MNQYLRLLPNSHLTVYQSFVINSTLHLVDNTTSIRVEGTHEDLDTRVLGSDHGVRGLGSVVGEHDEP